MRDTPFYNPDVSYETNYEKGPFGDFANRQVVKQSGKPSNDFLGQRVYLPFGIPAGPVINSQFAKAAFEKGFDIVVYKTVRSSIFPCHPFPNILAVHAKGDITPQVLASPLPADQEYKQPLTITNSFGVPSKKPEIWQEDVKKAINYAGVGQVLIVSFMGTVRPDQTQKAFIDDYVLAAKLAKQTGAKILETNLSCPNIGNEGLVCYNLEITRKIVERIRSVIGNTPLIIKVGYYQDDKQMEGLAQIAHDFADSVAGINTLQAMIVDKNGKQALPGKGRLRSGVCGAGIKWAGIDFVTRLGKIKKKQKYSFSIEGVGGVLTPEDYFDYKEAGADGVLSATGAMWNPRLAEEIKQKVFHT